MKHFSNNTGKLNVGTTRSGGKVVDTWSFKSPFADAKKGTPVQDPKLVVQVSIDKKNSDDIHFVARGDCLRESISDTDINALRKKVEAELRFQHDMLTGVVWEDWLQVAVSGNKSEFNSEIKDVIALRYRVIKRGVDPKTDHVYTININGIATDFPKPKRSGEEEEDSRLSMLAGIGLGNDSTDEFSYIPATSENIAGLHEIMARMDALRARMADFLQQDTISTSLSNLSEQLLALPSSSSTPKSTL